MAVLHNGEAPRQHAEVDAVDEPRQQTLQQQQQLHHHRLQQERQSLPGYHYNDPTTTAQHASMTATSLQHTFPSYHYTAPAVMAITTTTTTTRAPPTAAAAVIQATQPDGYIYNKPNAESYSRQIFYPPTSTLAISNEADVQQQLPLNTVPSYSVPQTTVVSSDKPNFFVPRVVTTTVSGPQATTQSPAAGKDRFKEENVSSKYNYARPANTVGLGAEPTTSYQRAFQEFTDYLIWQRAHGKQQALQQQQQVTGVEVTTKAAQEEEQKHRQHTFLHTTQPQVNVHRQPAKTLSESLPQATQQPSQAAAVSFPTQNYAQSATAIGSNIPKQQAAGFLSGAPTAALAERLPISSGTLLTGERHTFKDNTVEYLEMPSESWELPSYYTMELQEPHKNLATVVSTAKDGQQAELPINYATPQANQQYFYEPAKQLTLTNQTPSRAALERDEQRREQQQNPEDKHMQVSFAKQEPSDVAKKPAMPPAGVWFAKIPQWPQNLAQQTQQQQQQFAYQQEQQQNNAQQQIQRQQQPLYNRFVGTSTTQAVQVQHTANEPAQLPLRSVHTQAHTLSQQYQQDEKQMQKQEHFYIQPQTQAQPEPTRPQAELSNAAVTLQQNSQHPAQSTQAYPPYHNANPSAFYNLVDTSLVRRPHSNYGVPNQTAGYTYQRPAVE